MLVQHLLPGRFTCRLLRCDVCFHQRRCGEKQQHREECGDQRSKQPSRHPGIGRRCFSYARRFRLCLMRDGHAFLRSSLCIAFLHGGCEPLTNLARRYGHRRCIPHRIVRLLRADHPHRHRPGRRRFRSRGRGAFGLLHQRCRWRNAAVLFIAVSAADGSALRRWRLRRHVYLLSHPCRASSAS